MIKINSIMKKCMLCPRKCGIDRTSGQKGYCHAGAELKIGRRSLHQWEEPPISGTNGSGTVFFSYCSLRCIFCQNHVISSEDHGRYISEEELSDIFLELQKKGAHNINLVTPTHFLPQIISALKKAKQKGLYIPTVYNSGGYENSEIIKELSGIIDIFLPDMKYFSDKYAAAYSDAPGYFSYAKAALEEMVKIAPKPEFDENGIMKKGVIVRHMMLPKLLFDSKKIIEYLYYTYTDNIYISIMNQYTPTENAKKYPSLKDPISKKYYETLVDHAYKIGIRNAFIQEGKTASKSFIPDFYTEN